MAIVTKTMFETTDGKLFSSLEEAEQYEQSVKEILFTFVAPEVALVKEETGLYLGKVRNRKSGKVSLKLIRLDYSSGRFSWWIIQDSDKLVAVAKLPEEYQQNSSISI